MITLITQVAYQPGVDIEIRKIETTEQAQNMPSTWTTYSLFYDGKFITNEILSKKKFENLLEKWGL